MKKETLINFQPTFAAVDVFFNEWNKDFEKLSDPRRLKQTTRHIAEACVRLYGRQLAKAGKILVDPANIAHELDFAPDFSTNNSIVAREVGCSKRTAYTHLKKLLDANFFTSKKHHGPVHNFDLRFNKSILAVRCLDDLETVKEELAALIDQSKAETGIRYFAEEERQSSLQSYSSRNLIKNDNSPLNSVEMSNSHEFGPEHETTGNKAGNKGKEGKKIEESNPESQFISPELNKELQEQDSRPRKPKQLQKNLEQYALELWYLAAKLIWFDWEFGPKQLEALKTMLIPYFEPAQSTAEAKKYFKNYAERLKIAAKYYEKHPDFDKVHPFTYFDPGFKYGFSSTKEWYVKKRAAEWEKIKQIALRKALKHYEKNKNVKTYAMLIRELKTFDDQALLTKFNRAISEGKSYNSLNNNQNHKLTWHSTTKTAATRH